MPDFPNLFFLLGPNTFAGHGGSGILTIELEMRYVMEMLKLMIEQGIASVDVLQEVHDATSTSSTPRCRRRSGRIRA